jgi:hypothetical protein
MHDLTHAYVASGSASTTALIVSLGDHTASGFCCVSPANPRKPHVDWIQIFQICYTVQIAAFKYHKDRDSTLAQIESADIHSL